MSTPDKQSETELPTDSDGLPLPRDETVNLDEIGTNPSLDERSFFPLYLLEDRPDTDSYVEQSLDNIRSAVENGTDPENLLVCVSDYGDADGRGCVAIYTHKHQDTETDVIYVPAGHRNSAPDPIDVLEQVSEVVPSGATVSFTDLSPNETEEDAYADVLVQLADQTQLKIRDHHPWPAMVVDAVEPVADSFVVESREKRPVCATQLVLREDYLDAPRHIKELAYVTAARDLWVDDHAEFHGRGADINDFAFNCEFGEYAPAVAEYGADIREHPDAGEMIEQVQTEKQAKVQRVADAAKWFRFTLSDPVFVSDQLEYDHESETYTVTPDLTAGAVQTLLATHGVETVLDAFDRLDARVSTDDSVSGLWTNLFNAGTMESFAKLLEDGTITVPDPMSATQLQTLLSDSPVWGDILTDVTTVTGDITFAVCYGSSYPSATGSELQSRGADVALMLKPLGGASFRSAEETPIAAHIATGMGGGGHACAAGCSPDIVLGQQEFLDRVQEGSHPTEDKITTNKANWKDFGREFREIMLGRMEDVLDVELVESDTPDCDAS